MDRILALLAADSWADAAAAVGEMLAQAASPDALSVGVTLLEPPSPGEEAEMAAVSGLRWQLADTLRFPAGMPELWQGERYVLTVSPAAAFPKRWDRSLIRALRRCPETKREGAVLTGWPPAPADPVDAVCPVAAERFDETGRLCFRRGTPLRYAAGPVIAAFLHPGFCFGPAAFFRQASAEEDPAFLMAYRNGWALWTMQKPLLRFKWEVRVRPEPLSAQMKDADRFCAWYGLDLSAGSLSPQTRLGIFTADLSFPTRVPVAVRCQERLRQALNRSPELKPLCVTLWIRLEEQRRNLPEEALRRFSYLSAIRSLPLLCYTDSDMARRVTRLMPNVLEYKARYGLPGAGDRPDLNALKLSKPFLLSQSREKFLMHSHYLWIDFDYLRYPVYSGAALEWQAICTDKIVMATNGGRPDTSLLVIPEKDLRDACAWVEAAYAEALRTGGCLPDETDVWAGIEREHPDRFTCVELPSRQSLLELTMMTREEEFGAVP